MIARRVDCKTRGQYRRAGFTWIEAGVALAVIVLLIFLLLPAQRIARPAARRTQCKSNLKQIGLALYNYHDVYGTFPPAYTVDADGKPLHSWRTLILPYLYELPAYQQIDLTKPWDDPANAEAFKAAPHVYHCPSDGFSPPNHTTYLAVATLNSCFCSTQSTSIKEITDGASNTLMVCEVPHEHAVHWMCPQDADERLLLSLGPKSRENHTGGRQALLADGTVRFLANTIDAKTLLALCSATGGETVGEF